MDNRIFFILLVTAILMACSNNMIPADKTIPSNSIKLKKELNEISGLAWVSDSILACVQDEKAHVYYLDSYTGKILDSFDFGHNGDFEGIAVDGNKTFILRSDGHILISKKRKKAKEYKFKKGKDFDFEGLCLDKPNNRLLVACKEHGQKQMNKDVYIFGFSLEEKKYLKDPAFVLNRRKLGAKFKPSGISIHPNGDIYILSSFSKSLAVINQNGDVLEVIHLDPNIYHQPEGICFDSKGNVFISNEKKNAFPSLLKLEIIK
ncbi:MAG: SdiA-regulated domain-containing protein [Flavobacteriales bacterium]